MKLVECVGGAEDLTVVLLSAGLGAWKQEGHKRDDMFALVGVVGA